MLSRDLFSLPLSVFFVEPLDEGRREPRRERESELVRFPFPPLRRIYPEGNRDSQRYLMVEASLKVLS